MSKKVDHTARRREVVAKALRLFSQVGYENVSLNMIAAATGISRTILYRYYCSKQEVMDAAIKSVLDVIAHDSGVVLKGKGTAVEKLTGVCHATVNVMYAQKEFLVAVFDFVIGRVRTGADMRESIGTFTAGSRAVIRRLLELGKRRGELAPVLDLDRTTDVLYAGFESCAMRIVLGQEKNAAAACVRFSDIIRAIASWK